MSAGPRHTAPMPAAELPEFLEREGGSISWRGAGGLLIAHVVTQDEVDFHAPEMDAHFLGLALEGRAYGHALADGLVSEVEMHQEPGRVSFLPEGRGAHVVAGGEATYLQVMIEPGAMRSAMAAHLKGDPDRIDLFAFNTVLNAQLEGRLRKVHAILMSGGDLLAADLLAQEICAELAVEYSSGRVLRPFAEPRLTRAQMMRALDLLEACIPVEVGIEEIAQAMEMDPIEFARAFEVEVELDPATFLAERRLDRAVEVMREEVALGPDGEPDLAKLAWLSGHASPVALNAAFRKRFGVGLAGFRDKLH